MANDEAEALFCSFSPQGDGSSPLVMTLEEPSSDIEIVVAFRFGAAIDDDLFAAADEFSLMEVLLLLLLLPISAFSSF